MKKILISLGSILAILLGTQVSSNVAVAKHHENIGDFISVQELKTMMDEKNPKLILIGALHNKKRYIPLNNAGKPIDGTFEVWRPDYSGKGSTEAASTVIDGFRKSKAEMEVLLSKAGATQDSIIVVYSADAMHDAARVYWQIKLLGHDQVKILDGGVNAWLAVGYEDGDSEDLVKEGVKTEYKAKSYDVEKWGVDVNQIIAALDNPTEWVVIDTRSPKEQIGQKTGSSSGAYGTGGLIGTLNINWSEAVNKDQTVKTKAELKELYKAINGRKVITFCQSGVRSAYTQAVLKEVLGLENVYNYDGSWIELSYLASEASKNDKNVDSKLRETVRNHLSNWNDNKKPI